MNYQIIAGLVEKATKHLAFMLAVAMLTVALLIDLGLITAALIMRAG